MTSHHRCKDLRWLGSFRGQDLFYFRNGSQVVRVSIALFTANKSVPKLLSDALSPTSTSFCAGELPGITITIPAPAIVLPALTQGLDPKVIFTLTKFLPEALGVAVPDNVQFAE